MGLIMWALSCLGTNVSEALSTIINTKLISHQRVITSQSPHISIVYLYPIYLMQILTQNRFDCYAQRNFPALPENQANEMNFRLFTGMSG